MWFSMFLLQNRNVFISLDWEKRKRTNNRQQKWKAVNTANQLEKPACKYRASVRRGAAGYLATGENHFHTKAAPHKEPMGGRPQRQASFLRSAVTLCPGWVSSQNSTLLFKLVFPLSFKKVPSRRTRKWLNCLHRV